MMIRTRCFKWLALCAIGILALPAGAGESPLSQLPAETPLVYSFHGYQRTKERLAALIEKAVPDLAKDVLAKMDQGLDEALHGRKITGLDPSGPLFVVLTSLPKLGGGEPAIAVVAKVTDYNAFRDGMLTEEERKNLKKDKAGYETTSIEGKDVFFVHRKGYVTIAVDKEIAEQFVSHKGSGLEGKLNKSVARRLLDSDVALYVDMAAVNKEYGAELQGMRQFLPGIIEQGAQGQLDKNMLKTTKDFIEAMFQAIQDSRHVLLTLSLPPEGIALHLQAGFAKDSSTNKFLAVMKPAAPGKLDTLPPGYLAYLAAEWGPEAFKTIEPLVLGVLGTPDGAQAKALQEAMDQLIAAGPGPALGATAPPNRSLSVVRFEQPDKGALAQLKFYEALAEVKTFGNMPLKEKPVIRPEAETFRGKKFHYFSVKWDLDKQFANLPVGGEQLAQAMKKLTGEGVNVWFGAVEGAVVSVQAKDWKGAEKLLAQYVDKSTSAGAKYKSFAQTLERLPTKTTLVAAVSVPGVIDVGVQYVAALMEAFGRPGLQLAKAKTAEPFLGVSVTLQSGYAGLDLWVPAETARDIRRAVEAVIGAAQAQ